MDTETFVLFDKGHKLGNDRTGKVSRHWVQKVEEFRFAISGNTKFCSDKNQLQSGQVTFIFMVKLVL